jgi:hypothetical protein
MMAGARGRRDEPGPGHLERFCHVAVPDLLTGVCHVSTELAARIGDDILGPRGILRDARRQITGRTDSAVR